ncbi:hypothetical protein [Acidovorax carolinensis]|uniref:hypothetical protein n=1 Tax=Acidovorax carolinensis TaxID=553814 RepID=UPI000B5EF63F|nr:hypothetical protein [Acidovorax carolinensis]ART57148.1 hypothetical protein CBP35_19740 [Acidovorax carolinensis]
MKTLLPTSLAIALAIASGAAGAQTNLQANEQRCQQLAQEVNQEFQQAVRARAPKEDPTTFNQNSFDINSLLSQDTSAGFWKLASSNFGALVKNMVGNTLQKTIYKGQQQFSTRMNSMLNDMGVPGVVFQQSMNSVVQNVSGNLYTGANNVSNAAGSGAVSAVESIKARATPYSR